MREDGRWRDGNLTALRCQSRAGTTERIAYETREARMKTQNLTLHVPVDAEIRQKSMAALATIGLTATDAVRLLFHRIASDQAFALELKVPNARTRSAMAEVDEMVNARGTRFANEHEMFAELEEASGQQEDPGAVPG